MSSVPSCVGIILDGNRRWAKEHGVSSLEGHRAGAKKVGELIQYAREVGIGTLILYAFSSENWNRKEEEVAYLMKLLEESITSWTEDFKKEGGRFQMIGERERLAPALQEAIRKIEEETKEGTNGTVVVALSYGGRSEILVALNKLLEEKAASVDEAGLRAHMWSAKVPDPDLIIRTGGEKRLSNFLTWQSVYSELHFTDTKLPDLSKEEFLSILDDYAARERRHGR